MASDIEKRGQFVGLRAKGMSYAKISEEIGVSKTSLIIWSKELKLEIKNEQAMELERLREKYLLGREHRIRVNGTQLSQITGELLRRNLNEVPTQTLFDMQRKLIKEVRDDTEEIVFSEKRGLADHDSIMDRLTRTESWSG
ncbi:MAG: hypothetical protein K9M75_02800 [Phycisphaerae bacterium]|nr:hypothetical protein [Phycisphaerae bacterium]